jgi:hypothetical protein
MVSTVELTYSYSPHYRQSIFIKNIIKASTTFFKVKTIIYAMKFLKYLHKDVTGKRGKHCRLMEFD